MSGALKSHFVIIVFLVFVSFFLFIWSKQKVPLPIFGASNTSVLKTFNVDDFRDKADGIDDTEAFNKAWKLACSAYQESVLLIPNNGNYYIKPIKFLGPCKSPLTLKIRGTITASSHLSDYRKNKRFHWIEFEKVDNLRVEGGGTFNGNGRIWWNNSCKVNKSLPCTTAPTAVTFSRCSNLRIANLMFRNAQKKHLTIKKCVNAKALNLTIIAPENSPNTDGIHVTSSHNIQIMNSVIRTGDDCISIVSKSKNVTATGITCGPGHGISIGSLGAKNSKAYVSDVVVNRAKLSGTTNGVRIKTWQGGSGYAKNIRFENIDMDNVRNPIIIDQNYCDRREPCTEQAWGVQISNVVYSNIKGTSASEVGLKLECSKRFPCRGIVLENVNLVRQLKNQSLEVEASCRNIINVALTNTTTTREITVISPLICS